MSHGKARRLSRVKMHEHLPHKAPKISARSLLELFSRARLCDDLHSLFRAEWQKTFSLGCHGYGSQTHSNPASRQNERDAHMRFTIRALHIGRIHSKWHVGAFNMAPRGEGNKIPKKEERATT